MNEIIFVLLAMILIIAFQAVQINKLEKAYKDYSNKQFALADATHKLLKYKQEDAKTITGMATNIVDIYAQLKEIKDAECQGSSKTN